MLCKHEHIELGDFGAICREHGSDKREELKTIQGNLGAFRLANRTALRETEEANKITKANTKMATSILVGSFRTEPEIDDDSRPSWANEIHVTHDAWIAAGLVFCGRCGSIAAARRRGSSLLNECKASASNETVTLPQGSKCRLGRAKRGVHPDPIATHWPDGRVAGEKVKVRATE